MSILLFMLFGLLIGLLARLILPGKNSMGVVATALLGMAGSLLGGVIGNLFSFHRSIFELRGSGFVGSLLGALAVLALVTRTSLGRRHHHLAR